MKEVFVFGAGASAASAHTPLGSELVWDYHLDCALLKPYASGKPDNSEENRWFANFEKFLILAGDIYPELRGELEVWRNRDIQFYAPYFQDKKYYVDEILKIVQERGDREAVNLIKTLIFEHITESAIGAQNELYKHFVGKILKSRQSGSVSIISFNFDFLLHEDFRSDVYFDYLLDFDWIDTNRTRNYKKRDPIHLIKLNGSLDWGICGKCSMLLLYFHHMGKGFFEDKRCIGCKGSVEPFIILPHQKHSERANVLWTTAENKLKRAEKVTIIGYSFPEYDQQTRELFRKALDANVEVEVVDFSEPNTSRTVATNRITRKYEHMFSNLKKDIKVSLDGFAAYVDEYRC